MTQVEHPPITTLQSFDELCAALDQTGASGRYALLLHGATIETLEPFFLVGERVRARPELLLPFIDDRNWRVTLVGTALAVLIRSEQLVTAMVAKLVAGSWVAPQLAAGIASMGPGSAALDPLRQLLARCTMDSDPKTVLSAHAALALVNDSAAREFDATSLFAALWKRDGVRCHQVAARWRGIWQVAGPYFRHRIGASDTDDLGPAA